jgi:hypothetical protein
MPEAVDPVGDADPPWVWPFLLRLVLTAAFLGTAWATMKARDRWLLVAKSNFNVGSVGGWLPWMAGSVLAGLIFGFALWLPRRIAFRATTAIALGVVPLLGMVSALAYLHFRWWPSNPFVSPDSTIFFGCLFGIAVASGFGDGARRTGQR